MMSAYCLDGSINCINIGRTVSWYCFSTDSMVRPRSCTSRFTRRSKQISSGVSINTVACIKSRRRGSVRSRMPSRMITFFGVMVVVCSVRVCSV
ncbi:Uncharacterised protein [Vibrio cholerae]|nr:Uncharacterised protein [Vibrio cholerae]